MISRNIAGARVGNQGIGSAGATAAAPTATGATAAAHASAPGAAAIVARMGCLQSQDFHMAKWALGVRNPQLTEASIDADFNEGKILRTHVLRPTWHFVLPADIRWMLRLTAPRIRAFCKGLYRKLEIDEPVLRRSKRILEKTLAAEGFCTREQLAARLVKGKVNTDDIRLAFLLMDAELEGLICSGPRQGKRFTYALLEERVPGASTYPDESEAIAELAKRYFTTRGPATLQDFAWWSGLNQGKAKIGIELNKGDLACVVSEGQAYWFADAADKNPGATDKSPGAARKKPGAASPVKKAPAVHLLPAYDEYTVSYKDRSDILHLRYQKPPGLNLLKPIVVVGGQFAGTWKRTLFKDTVKVDIDPYTNLKASVRQASARYAHFIGKELYSGNG